MVEDQPQPEWVLDADQETPQVLSNTEDSDNSASAEPISTEQNHDAPLDAEIASGEEEEMTDEHLLSAMLSERYGQEFNDFSAYEDYITERHSKETTESPFANETLQQINDYIKETGRSVEDYMTTQSLQPDEMSDEEAVLFMLERDNPGLSKEDLKFFMSETYKLEAADDSSEKRFGQIALKKEAIKSKNEISQFKAHYQAPTTESAADAAVSEQVTAEQNQFYSDVVEDMQAIEGLTFDIDDKGAEFTFAINDDNRPAADAYVGQLDNFFGKYVGEDGNWDYDSLNTDMFILNNIDSIVKSVANHYKSQGTEEVVQELKNPSYGGQDSKPAGSEAPSMAQQIQAAMKANNDY